MQQISAIFALLFHMKGVWVLGYQICNITLRLRNDCHGFLWQAFR